MTQAERIELSGQDLETLAWKFLGSKFTEHTYADWSIDRRVDAYLRHHGKSDIADDGEIHMALLDCIMANFGRAQRRGIIAAPHALARV